MKYCNLFFIVQIRSIPVTLLMSATKNDTETVWLRKMQSKIFVFMKEFT